MADGDQGGQRRKKTTKERKDERIQVTIHVGTWNLQGKLSNAAQRETLSKDMQSRKSSRRISYRERGQDNNIWATGEWFWRPRILHSKRMGRESCHDKSDHRTHCGDTPI